MSSEPPSFSYYYQQSLLPLTKGAADARLAKRLSELLALFDFSSTLNRSLQLPQVLDLVLFISMGELAAAWAAVALSSENEALRIAAHRGRMEKEPAREVPLAAGEALRAPTAATDPDLSDEATALFRAWGASFAAPLRKDERLIGVLILGAKPGGYQEGDRAFVEALSATAAASIDNGRIYEELRRVNNRLSLKVYQLNSLFDITRELHGARSASQVRQVLLAGAMGQLLATRCALTDKERFVALRGLPPAATDYAEPTVMGELASLDRPERRGELMSPPLRRLLESLRLEAVVPLRAGNLVYGTLLVGGKANGELVSDEDLDFLASLSAQAAAALDNLRLTEEWIEKRRMEKELAMAREIQRALLPDSDPGPPGWDIAGVNIPCLTVGGDYYDYIDSPGGKLGLVIADVSGKGTGPALLMASAQASLRVLSQDESLAPAGRIARLNAHLYRNTEANKFMTLFLGVLDPGAGTLGYVNAGHCYPLHLRGDGGVERLVEGGPVLGLFPDLDFQQAETRLLSGDVLIMYTDGLSETRNPEGEEFGEARIIERAMASRSRPAREMVGELVGAALAFAASAGLGDDLTVMVLKRGWG
jgi:sigma-B regulation protein RsbU (phosphoserine phosphatase)